MSVQYGSHVWSIVLIPVNELFGGLDTPDNSLPVPIHLPNIRPRMRPSGPLTSCGKIKFPHRGRFPLIVRLTSTLRSSLNNGTGQGVCRSAAQTLLPVGLG